MQPINGNGGSGGILARLRGGNGDAGGEEGTSGPPGKKKPSGFGGRIWPVAFFVVYAAVAIGIGTIIFSFFDIGTETTTTTERDAANAVTKSTVEEKQSIPIILIFTTLAAGGWILIPLKFTWDELSKNADAARHESEDISDDRRQVAGKMRDLVFGSVTSHFGPMLYRQRSVARWAERCLKADAGTGADYQVRLLYSIALLHDCYNRVREQGVPIILRSVKAEGKVTAANAKLQECLQDTLGVVSDFDFQLMAAACEGAPEGMRYVPYPVFRERVESGDLKWGALGNVAACLSLACANEAGLRWLRDCANCAEQALADGLNEVYGEWYLDVKTGE